MKDRIKIIRKNEKLSQTEFGKLFNMTKDTIFNIESGRKIIKSTDIESICRKFNINEEWIITGKGSMYKTSEKNKDKAFLLNDIITKDYFNETVLKLSSLNDDEFNLVSNLIDMLSQK